MTTRTRVPYAAPRTCCDGRGRPVTYHLKESKMSINQYGVYGRCGDCGQIRHLERDT